MNESFLPQPTPQPPQGPQPKIPEYLASGVYATAMVVSHGREEFVLDFIVTLAPPPRLAARVIVSPPHAKRLARALRENVGHYEKNFGSLPVPPIQQAAHTIQARDFYSQLVISDELLGGVYSNNVMIRHTREEFVFDFLVGFQPIAILNARVVVSPPHILRIANAIEARIRIYEDVFGVISDSPEPPEPPGSRSRFSLS